ncbi:hypothetical protein QO062_02720 [Fervidobacterium pennivorans subsp. carthaginiensis]|nr:hypothetical protein [Fervidobacterium pennivorans]QIV78771.1 hypothetical protein HER11_07415 [Fervidobacterium pennivorans subsp. keratinolyticus]
MPSDDELLVAANVLSQFAFYSGVGYKVTMGLWQAKRIESTERFESEMND